MKLFVAGGAGYIGACLSRHLINTGHTVTIYDSLVTGHRETVPENAYFIQGQLGDSDLLQSSLQSDSYDAVIHLAASTDARESMRTPGTVFHNNVSETLMLLSAMAQCKTPRLIFASSYSIYDSRHTPFRETSPLRPASVYAQTKLMGEQAIKWYAQLHGINSLILRFPNVAGAMPGLGEDHSPERHLIPRILKVALGVEKEFRVFGYDLATADGTPVRDFIHVADIARAVERLLEDLDLYPLRVLNVSSGEGRSVNDILQLAREITGHPIPVTKNPARPGDPPSLISSPQKLMEETGFELKHSDLRTMVASAWEWHKSLAAQKLETPKL